MEELSYVLTQYFVSCVHVRFYFSLPLLLNKTLSRIWVAIPVDWVILQFWQQKAEDALKRATEDSDSGEYKLRGIKYRLRQIFVQYYREVLESFLNISNLQKRPKTFITTTEQLICFCFNFGRDVYQRGRYVSPVKRSEGRVSKA